MVARNWYRAAGVIAIILLTEMGCATVTRDNPPPSSRPASLAPAVDLAVNPASEPPRQTVARTLATAPVTSKQRQPSGVSTAATMLILGGLAGTLWFEHRRRQIAEVEGRRHLATMAHLNRRASMGEMTASLAHELHQPLGAILRNSEAATLLLTSGAAPVNELREIVEDIRKEDKRATEIIRRMRAFLGRHDLHEEPVDLNDVARETVDLIASDAAFRGVRIDIDAQRSSAPVLGDRVHLQQALLNVLLNGMEAMRHTPIEHRRLIVSIAARNGAVDVSVGDFGSGIPPHALKRVFEPFYTTKPDGMGMGLSIVRSIVEAHNGSIRAENNPDRGATVRFSLPLRHDQHSLANE
jgi:signal transduction histidine kinase